MVVQFAAAAVPRARWAAHRHRWPRALSHVPGVRGAFDVGGIFDVENFQYGFYYIVLGTEYRVLNLVVYRLNLVL